MVTPVHYARRRRRRKYRMYLESVRMRERKECVI
jgi:hypothetical protein